MRNKSNIGSLILMLGMQACASPQHGQPSDAARHATPAVEQAAQLHASEIGNLAIPEKAGLWVVEDSAGNLLASGVLRTFPASISSEDYEQVVPGAAGLMAQAFGFTQAEASMFHPALQVAFVTVSGS